MNVEVVRDERVTKELVFDEYPAIRSLYGERGANFKILENFFRVQLSLKGNHIFITGEKIDSELAEKAIAELYKLIKAGYNIYPSDVEYASKIILENPKAKLKDIFLDTILVTSGRKIISPKGITQKKYIEAIRKSEIEI